MAQFMNNPESSDSCPLQVSVQTLTENDKFVFNRILQMTYNLPGTYISHTHRKRKKRFYAWVVIYKLLRYSMIMFKLE